MSSSALRVVTALLVSAFVAAACQAPRIGPGAAPTGAEPDFTGRAVNIVTGPTGGVYIVYGAGIANALQNKLKVSATAQSTTASVDNMKFIRDGRADVAMTLPDIAHDAVNGKGRFAPPEQPAKAKNLAVLYTNFMHIVVRDGIGINALADLRGKRVSVGAPGSGTEVKGLRVIETVGLTKADLQAQNLGPAESATAMKDGRLDAFFWDGGLPTAAITDLVNTATFRVKFLDQTDAVPKMVEKYGPFYFVAPIPSGTYKNEADVKVAGVANLLVVPETMEEPLAYAITKTLFESKADLENVHPEAKNLKLETAVEGSPIDYHAGAIRYYREKNVWKR
jgi:TRAP transporter TAXI family solute receptor